jgi:hypothetical protein
MSYNGSGTFNINSAGQPVVAGTVISATAFNALTADLGVGLSTAITKDGQTTTTARITFAQGVTSSLTTDSSSTSTGSIITAGGVGIAKALFVGTTANVAGVATLTAGALIQGLTVGRGAGAVSTNTAVGFQALANTSVGLNTVYGYQAGFSNTTANLNSYFGYQAGYTLSTGGECSAFGYTALKFNTGANNNAFGGEALALNTTGANNNAFGVGALGNNLGGSNNVAMGQSALNANSSGGTNTAIGGGALQSNTTASNNTAVGYQAGYAVTTGGTNAFFGQGAGFALTTGIHNTFIGRASGEDITTGTRNSILGRFSGNQGGLDIRTADNYIVLSDGDGNPLISTADNQTVALEGAVPNSGIGITFPATQSASSNANTLDDYEEGTWTPTQGAGLTVVGTFSAGGNYTKIGNQVTVWGFVAAVTSVAVASAGTAFCAGLPFTPNASSTNASLAVNNSTNATMGLQPTGASTGLFAAETMASTTRINFTATYFV